MDLKVALDKSELVDQSPACVQKTSMGNSRICEECDQTLADYHCTECEQDLCCQCDKQIHNKGARKNHHRMNLQLQPSSNKEILNDSKTFSTPYKGKPPSGISSGNGSMDNSGSHHLNSNHSPFYPKQPLKASLQRILYFKHSLYSTIFIRAT